MSYHEQLCDKRWRKKRSTILRRDNYSCRMCGCEHTDEAPLEIHHRYYKYGAYAWCYNNSALITLCRSCHHLVHKTLSPLIYYYDDDKIELIPMNFTPCKRCGGYGYFPEYEHVENGICFRCRGEKYEELISHDDNKTKNVQSHLLHKRDCYDVAHPLKKEAVRSIYEQGLNFHFGVRGFKKDMKKAHERYKKAALNGNPDAQNNYACLLCFDGREKEAIRWFLYSAMQGVCQAKFNLAMLTNDEVFDRWFDLVEQQEKIEETTLSLGVMCDNQDFYFDEYLLVKPDKSYCESKLKPRYKTLVTKRYDNGHLIGAGEIEEEMDDPKDYTELILSQSSLSIKEYCARYKLDLKNAFVEDESILVLPQNGIYGEYKKLILDELLIQTGDLLGEKDLIDGLSRFNVLEHYGNSEYDGTLIDIFAILSYYF